MGTIGFDIEFFTADNNSLRVVPVCGKIGGDKEKHRFVATTAKAKEGEPAFLPWEIHEDNVSLEVNSPVFTDEQDMYNWLGRLHTELNHDLYYSNVPIHLASWRFQKALTFPRQVLVEAGNKALEIGCDPDYCAYNDPPNLPRKIDTSKFETGERYVGAHVHMGYSTHKGIPPHYVARLMDLIALSTGSFSDAARGAVYGPGLFRPKPYGIEYRSLGTATLMSAEGKTFSRMAFLLANKLETEPQEMARIYGEYTPAEWGLLSRYWEERNKKVNRPLDALIGKAAEHFYLRNWTNKEYLKNPATRRDVLWEDIGIEGEAA
jgi:hypothetical protein